MRVKETFEEYLLHTMQQLCPNGKATFDVVDESGSSNRPHLSNALLARSVEPATPQGWTPGIRTTRAIRRRSGGIAAEESGSLTRFRALLEGLDHLCRSIGSTPTASIREDFSDCDEVRPGNYVFYDAFQATIGSCDLADVAVSVLTTVVGSYPDRRALIIDAGALALSKDVGPDHIDPRFGYGIVCDVDLRPLPMRIAALSQEHGKVEAEHPVPVGTKLRILPNHSCLTAAMFDAYQIVDRGKIVDQWKPVRGW